jgi:hypothetical protein
MLNLSVGECERIAEKVQRSLMGIKDAAKALNLPEPDAVTESFIHNTVEQRLAADVGRKGRHEQVRRRPAKMVA